MKKILLLLLFSLQTVFAQNQPFTCGVNDDELSAQTLQAMKQVPEWIKERKLRKAAIDDFYFCRLAIEIDYETFKKYNGDTLYIKNEVALMVQKVSKIYEKEIQTKLILTNINIWNEQAKDPYSGISDIFVLLDKVKIIYTSNPVLMKVPSDIIMYLPTKPFTGAGGVASGKYNLSPWNGISTIAHEIGHNFGSPHTQSCGWAGGAIDFCYAVEGNCYVDALENINGTLMSYCGRRLNTFHPLCIELMSKNASTRYQKVKTLTENVKLNENWVYNSDNYVSWNGVNLSENYHLELATDSDFKNIAFRDTALQNYTTLPFLKKNQAYFLRIQPANRLGIGQWSNTMQVSTPSNMLETPKLISPANNSIDVNGNTLTFNFEALPEVSEYQLQYITFSSATTSYSFDSPTSTRLLTTNTFAISLSSEGISWRVRSKRGTVFGAWSKPFTMWLQPNSANLDLTQQAINGYPLSFPVNYFGNVGSILEVSLKVSEKSDYSNPIVNKSWNLSKYSSQTNYPYLLQNLKPNTTYFIKFEEHNREAQNIIGLPNGLVRFSEKTFKTGSETLPKSFNYFNNSNVANLSRNIKKVAFNDNFAFISTNEGIIRMKLDGTESRLIDRENSKGNISNTLLDIKTDAKGDLWILTQVSKRIAFNGVFPKPTYRLARVNPTTFDIIQSDDFYGGNATNFQSFDSQSKILTNNLSYFHKIVRDSTQSAFTLPTNTTFSNVQWGNGNYWLLVFDNNTRINQVKNIDIATNKETNFDKNNSILNTNINQIYLDAKENIWALNQGNTPLVKWNKETGWSAITNYNLVGSPRIIGEYNEILYLYVVNGLNRDIFSYNNTVFKKIESIPNVNSSGSFELDKVGRIWFWQSDRLLRINPCSNLAAPILQASRKQILKGESIELKAEGCTNVAWTFNVENQNPQTFTVFDKNTLTVKPESATTYKAKCLDSDCVSEFSNLIEADVLALSLVSADKKKYCSGERISLNLSIKGRFDSKNDVIAVFSNKDANFTIPLGLDGGLYKSLIPTTISNAKYWVKLKTTNPIITSSDSIEVNLFQTPRAKITGVSELFLLDSTKITINLLGTPPFNFKYGTENITTNLPTISRNFYPSTSKTYTLTVSELSDANCTSNVINEGDLSVKVSINPKFQQYWVLYFPNPVEDDLNLHVYNKPGVKLAVELYNLQGKLIFQKDFPIISYLDKYKIDMRDFASGVYLMKINTGFKEQVIRIVK